MIDRPTRTLKFWRPGEPIPHVDLNETNRAIERLFRGIGPAQQRVAAANDVRRRFRFKSMGADHIIARTWDGTTEGTIDTPIAKPFLLRRSITARGGLTYTYTSDTTRTASDGATTEDQVVVDSYVLDDEIYADRVQGGTGVDPVLVGGVSTRVVWLDANLDARAWARVSA